LGYHLKMQNKRKQVLDTQSSPLIKDKKSNKPKPQPPQQEVPSPTSTVTSDEPILTRFMKNAPMCGICYFPIEKQGTLDICHHEFCFKCIETWAKTENSCPMCKKRFSKIKNIWKRPYYGENTRKKVCTPSSKEDVDELPDQEIEIPTRNQNSFDGLLTVERLLNFLIAIFPLDSDNLIGRSHIFSVPTSNDNQEISIEIMLHHANETLASIPITLSSANSTENSGN